MHAKIFPFFHNIILHIRFPKKSVCHKWIIEDAELSLVSASLTLNSASFLISGFGADISVCLCLSISKLPIYPKSSRSSLSSIFSANYVYECIIGLQNCETESGTVIATKCTFSLIHPITDVNYRESLTNINNFGNKSVSVKLKLEQDKFEKLLYEETLTVLFSATLIYFGGPNHSEIHQSSEPQSSDYSTTLLTKMRDNKLFYDMQIVANDKVFQVHRSVLATCSSVFRAMFETNMTEKAERILTISDISPQVMSDLLEYVYTGKTPSQTDEHVQGLLVAADKYDIQELVGICEKKLICSLTPTNVFEMSQFADQLRLKSLKQSCIYHLKKYPKDIFTSDSWKQLKETSLDQAMEIADVALTN